jgi:hypothetical protein
VKREPEPPYEHLSAAYFGRRRPGVRGAERANPPGVVRAADDEE